MVHSICSECGIKYGYCKPCFKKKMDYIDGLEAEKIKAIVRIKKSPYQVRKELGLNQANMAKAMGCTHYMTWWKWEASEQKMDATKKRMLKLLLILKAKGLLEWYLELFGCK